MLDVECYFYDVKLGPGLTKVVLEYNTRYSRTSHTNLPELESETWLSRFIDHG